MNARGRLRGALSGLSTPVILSAGLLGIVLLSSFASESLRAKLTTMLIFCVIVVGLYVFIGNSGVTSFGHVAFVAMGAYSAALVTVPALTKQFLLPDLPGFIRTSEVSPELGILVGAGVAAIFALIIAAPLMRPNGITVSFALLAVLIIVNVVFSQAEAITRGTRSLTGIPLVAEEYSTLVWAIAAIFVAFAYQRSRWGLRMRAARDDEIAAQAAGLRIPWERSIALVISAAVMGAGGALYGQALGSITPATFYLGMTVVTLVMLIVGGVRSLTGAVVGTVLIFLLSELLRDIESGVDLGLVSIPERPGLELIGISLAALLMLIWRPQGVTGGKEVTSQTLMRPLRAVAQRLRSGHAEVADTNVDDSPGGDDGADERALSSRTP